METYVLERSFPSDQKLPQGKTPLKAPLKLPFFSGNKRGNDEWRTAIAQSLANHVMPSTITFSPLLLGSGRVSEWINSFPLTAARRARCQLPDCCISPD